MAAIALLIFPRAALQPSLDINLCPFVENTLCNIGKPSPAYNIVPLSYLNSFIVASAAILGGCKGKRCFLDRHCTFRREADHIGIFTYISY